jgi:hypothetical protein
MCITYVIYIINYQTRSTGAQRPHISYKTPAMSLEQELLVITQEFIHSSSPDLLAAALVTVV